MNGNHLEKPWAVNGKEKKLSEIILEFLIDGYEEDAFGFGSWCVMMWYWGSSRKIAGMGRA